MNVPENTSVKFSKAFLRDIIAISDLADKCLEEASVTENGAGRGAVLRIVEPHVIQVHHSANILRALYCRVALEGCPVTPDVRDTIEKAFRNAVLSFDALRDALAIALGPPDQIDPQAMKIVGTWIIEARTSVNRD